jgi:hypothetical protein
VELVEISDEGYGHPDQLDVCRLLLFWDVVKDLGRSFFEFGPVGDISLQSEDQL